MKVSFHMLISGMPLVLRDMIMYVALNSGLRIVSSKGSLFQVGLARWELILGSTPEANEKVP